MTDVTTDWLSPMSETTTMLFPTYSVVPGTPLVYTNQVLEAPAPIYYRYPWPLLILAIVGIFLLIWTAITPVISYNRRVLGIAVISLWTMMWLVILWLIWESGKLATAWWTLFIPIIGLLVFFIIVIALDFDV